VAGGTLDVGGVVARLGARLDDDAFDRFDRRLNRARTEGERGATARLNVDTREGERGIDRFLGRLRGTSRGIEQEAARSRVALASVGNEAMRAAERGSAAADLWQDNAGRWRNASGDFASSAERAAAGLVTFSDAGGNANNTLSKTGLTLGATLPLIGSLIPVVVALSGAVTALAGSFAAAAAGAGAVGIGIAAAAGPLAALAGAVISRANLIGEAYKALGAQQDKAGASAVSSAEAEHAAALRTRQATLAVADARRAEARAGDELTQARFKARREVEDLTAAVAQSARTEEQASLTLREAQQRLRVLQETPGSSSLERDAARAAVRQAQADTQDAARQSKRAREDAARGTETVRNAERALEAATRQRASAQDAAREAARAASVANEKQGATATAADQALAKLSATERELVTTMRGFADTFRRAFQPATDAIFGGVNDALKRVEPLLTRFSGRFMGIGRTIGDVVRGASRELAGPAWTRALDSFIATSQRVVKPLSNAMGSVLVTLRNIAVASQQYVVEFAHWIERAMAGIAGKTADAGKVRDVIASLVEHTRSWAHFAGAVSILLFRIFSGGARDGRSLVETMTAVVNRWSAFLATKEGQERLRRFLHDAVERTKDLARVISVLSSAFFAVFEQINRHRLLFGLVVGGLLAMAAAAVGIPAAIVAVGAAFVALYAKSRTFREVIAYVFNSVRRIIGEDINFILGLFTTFAGGISAILNVASHLPVVGDKFRAAARGVDAARDAIDGLRRGIREATNPIVKLQDQILVLESRLRGLRKGTTAYNEVAEQLRSKQGQLNKAMGNAEPAGKRGALGPRALAKSAASAAGAVDESNVAITKGYNQLAKQLGGIKEITYSKTGVVVHGADANVTVDTGNILARAAGGWIGRPGDVGHDSIRMAAPVGAAVLNRHQLPVVALAMAAAGRSLDDLAGGHSSGGRTAPVIVAPGEFMVAPSRVGALDGALRGIGAGGLDDLFAAIQTPHYFAGGGRISALKARADHLASMHLPYKWGGGHGVGTISDAEAAGGVDCSGAVGYVLGIPARFSGDYNTIGRPGGSGEAVVYSNSGHTFMRIGGRYFGTSGFGHPAAGTGAAWFTVAPSAGYLSGFTARSLGANDIGSGSGMTGVGDLVAPTIRGPAGMVRRVAQRAVSRVAAAANRKLGTAFGTNGQGLVDARTMLPGGPGRVVGASVFGGPGDPGTGHVGYRGDDLNVHPDSFAELNMGTALGGLPYLAGLRVTGPRGSMRVYKRDIGRGGGSVQGKPRAIDLWYQAAQHIGISGLGLVKYSAFARGGTVRSRPKPILSSKAQAWTAKRILRGNTGIVGFEDKINNLEARYNLANRRADLDPDDFLVEHDDGTVTVDESVRSDRQHELEGLRAIRQQIHDKIVEYIAAVKRAIAAYKSGIAQLTRAISAAKGASRSKERAGYKDTREAYRERMNELAGTLNSLGLDREGSNIDLAELGNEISAVSPASAAASASKAQGPSTIDPGSSDPGSSSILTSAEQGQQAQIGMAVSLARLTADPTDDEAARATGEAFWRAVLSRLQGQGAGPEAITQAADTLAGLLPTGAAANSALANAQAIFDEVERLNAGRANLFGSFGANFAAAGSSVFGTEMGRSAGTRFYGAGQSGAAGVLASAGGVQQTINVTIADPGDVHTFTQTALHELQAAI
jgi:uncharacterized phage infection (PIP) family protein YhgE